MKIYLAGSVPKGDSELKTFDNWRQRYQKALKHHVKATFIDPYVREADERDFLLVAGLDCKQVKESDVIIVNAEGKLGAGTSIELAVAKYFHRPVITVLPKDSHHRRSNVTFHGALVEDWIHPFVHTFSDVIVEGVDEITTQIIETAKHEAKNIRIVDEAISYAEKTLA